MLSLDMIDLAFVGFAFTAVHLLYLVIIKINNIANRF